ncbi:MAG: TraR/DksA C4-type zinc finger protein [Candidatus Schekmanbacteria bacterium]|nr:TraR/DksA C4-type zinc finger protein [Candidatus Schekmanbacteria bacterium]
MDKAKITAIEKKLREEREQLLQEAGKTLSSLNQQQVTDELADFTDQSSMEWERNFLLRMKERERNLLIKIERTLEKIKEGTFGICEECGCEISEKRLEARPVVTLCVDCKTEQEKKEKYG